VWDNSKLQYASSKLDIGNICKTGRALLGLTGSLSSRVIDSFSDDLGRWYGGVILLGKQAKKYTIICAYQVPLLTGTSGPSTSHTQQLLLLKLADKVNQRQRHHFCKDLKYVLQECIKEDHGIILMGDFA
jgi:hypothetical protein